MRRAFMRRAAVRVDSAWRRLRGSQIGQRKSAFRLHSAVENGTVAERLPKHQDGGQ